MLEEQGSGTPHGIPLLCSPLVKTGALGSMSRGGMERILYLTSVRLLSSSEEKPIVFQIRADVDVKTVLGFICAS